MYKTALWFSAILTGVLLFQQNDYKITFERLELIKYNKEFVRNFTLVTFKYNRTTTTANATFTVIQNLNNDAQVVVQAYKFASNEYRLFPLRFQFDFCKTATTNDFGIGRFYVCGNFTKCPIVKGTYHICKWSPDESRFPPRIPNGQYRVDLNVLHSVNDMVTLSLYLTIYRPIKK